MMPIATEHNTVNGLFDGQIRFTWTKPDDNFDALTNYDIEVFN
jgi:hypothetical protein